MTALDQRPHGVSESTLGHSVLSRLAGVSPDDFATNYWGQQALLSTAADLPGEYGDLLSADAIDELVSARGLRTPFLRVAKNGTTLAEKTFTAPGGVGAGIGDQVSDDKLVRLFADGSTMVLQGLHRIWPPIIALCQALAAELGHPVQANAYVTPPQNQGFSNHYDVHDVFVLQIDGEKRWQIHAPVWPSPLRDQPWSDRKSAVQQRAAEPPLIEATLHPGDCLYLPRGFLHAAQALGGVSTHLTIGVHTWTRYALAEQLLHQALRSLAQDEASRGSLPLGVDFTDPAGLAGDAQQIRQALVDAIAHTDLDGLAAAMTSQARGTQRAAPIGPLRQLREANALTTDTVLRLRPHLAASLEEGVGRVVLHSRAGEFIAAPGEAAALRALLLGSVPVHSTGMELARRLLLAGLAVVE